VNTQINLKIWYLNILADDFWLMLVIGQSQNECKGEGEVSHYVCRTLLFEYKLFILESFAIAEVRHTVGSIGVGVYVTDNF